MQEQILETTLNDDNIIETEITAIQKDVELDHSKLENLDYEHSGHTGFQPAGDYIEDTNYVHTDNNYTTEEKAKLSNLENYDDTEIKSSLSNKVDKEVNKGLSTNDYTNEEKTKLAGLSNYDDTEVKSDITNLQNNKQNKIDSNNKLSSDLVDDTNNTNKFVTSNEKTTWNNKSDFSGNYNDLTNKPTIPDELKDLSDDSTHRLVTDTEKTTWNSKSDFSGDYNDLTNKPTIPTIPTNVSSFTNDSGYLVSGDLKTINSQSIVGSGDITITGGGDTTYIGTSEDFNTEAKAFDLTGLDKGIYLLTTTTETGFVRFWVKATRNSELKTYELSVHRNFQPIMNNICYLHITRKVDDDLANGTVFGYFTCFALAGGNCLYKFKRSLIFNSANGALTSNDDSTYQECMTTSSVDTITAKKTFNVLPESSVVPTTNNQLVNKKYVDDNAGGADIQINGTSIVSNNIANIVTNTAYDSSTNKIATMSDITSAIGTALGGSY